MMTPTSSLRRASFVFGLAFLGLIATPQNTIARSKNAPIVRQPKSEDAPADIEADRLEQKVREFEAGTDKKPLASSALPLIPVTAGPKAAAAKPITMEVVPTKNYIEFYELDPLPKQIITWDKNSGKLLYISPTDPPFLFLFGTIEEGYEVSINNRWVPVNNGRFELKVSAPLEPSTFIVKVFDPSRNFQVYRLAYAWLNFPPSLRYKVKEEEQIYEKAWGYVGRFSRSGWVQLFSDKTPVTVVDLDSQKNAKLYFRLYYPPEPEPVYDSWKLTIRDKQNQIVGEYRRVGAPPQYLDWREVNQKIVSRDTYTYQIDLTRDNQTFIGKPNRFETAEGQSLLDNTYYPAFQFEPKQELGFYSYKNARGQDYSNLYIGADIPFIFWNRLIVRGTGLLAMHTLDADAELSFVRGAIGLRFFTSGNSNVLGNPFFIQLNILAGISNYTVSPFANVNRFTHPSILFEPHMVLWGYHYIVPWFEYGSRLSQEEQRISFGLTYQFYVRPWSMKFGTGFAVDRLITFTGDDSARFTILRTMASTAFAF